MVRKIIRIIFSLAGGAIGYSLCYFLNESNIINLSETLTLVAFFIFVGVFALVFYFLWPSFFRQVEKLLDKTDVFLQKIPFIDIVIGTGGLLLGLIISFFISISISTVKLPAGLDFLQLILTIVIYFVISTVFLRLSLKNKEDIINFFSKGEKKVSKKIKKDKKIDVISNGALKIIDTSVLIDGRIYPIVKTGFVEGEFLIPNFVLEELQHIADSPDEVKRERGRRGLDIVKNLQASDKIKVEISYEDFEDVKEVDIKLLKLAKERNALVMTNDYNLNKLALVQDIGILNVNDLANAIKTIVIPGEEMMVNIIKEGREKSQGIAYLDDGTMIVVEDAKTLIGQQVHIVVATVLQTAAGKMIFANLKD